LSVCGPVLLDHAAKERLALSEPAIEVRRRREEEGGGGRRRE
jgi:hypothetical protein